MHRAEGHDAHDALHLFGAPGLGTPEANDKRAPREPGFHHGYESDEVQARVEDQFLAGDNPPESGYRETIMATTREIMPVVVERFIALP